MLTTSQITSCARRIADEDGLENVSMRELAHRLDCTPRALYRYVADKEELLELVADSAFADLSGPRTDMPWQEAFLEFFVGMRALLVESPAIALIIARLPVAGENFQRHADDLAGLMVDAGFEPEPAIEAVMALAYYTLGASLPGTGDSLLNAYRRLRDAAGTGPLPAVQRRAPGFPEQSAAEHFRSALGHLLRGYSVDG